MENSEFPNTYNVRVNDRNKAELIRNDISKLQKSIDSKAKQADKNRELLKAANKKKIKTKSN